MINTLPTAPTRSMAAADFVVAANTFLAALPPFSTQVNADLAALLTLSQLVATSTTSLTIGTGSKSLTVQTAKAYLAGQTVRIYSTATPDNYMDGAVTSYDSGTGALVVNVTGVAGSGTLAAWTVILNGGLATSAGSASQVFSVAAATAAAHAPQAAQIQSGALVTVAAALTGTEYSATPAPAITAYAAGQRFLITFGSACPAAPTLKLNGIATPPNLVRQKPDGTFANLAATDFPAGWVSSVVLLSASQALVERLPAETGSFTLTATGMSGTVTGTATYIKVGNVVTLELPALSGTSNSTSFGATGLPAMLTPSANRRGYTYALDNTTTYAISQLVVNSTGAISYRFGAGLVDASWTASGGKTAYQASVTYTL